MALINTIFESNMPYKFLDDFYNTVVIKYILANCSRSYLYCVTLRYFIKLIIYNLLFSFDTGGA